MSRARPTQACHTSASFVSRKALSLPPVPLADSSSPSWGLFDDIVFLPVQVEGRSIAGIARAPNPQPPPSHCHTSASKSAAARCRRPGRTLDHRGLVKLDFLRFTDEPPAFEELASVAWHVVAWRRLIGADSDFLEQWLRTTSNRMSSGGESPSTQG